MQRALLRGTERHPHFSCRAIELEPIAPWFPILPGLPHHLCAVNKRNVQTPQMQPTPACPSMPQCSLATRIRKAAPRHLDIKPLPDCKAEIILSVDLTVDVRVAWYRSINSGKPSRAFAIANGAIPHSMTQSHARLVNIHKIAAE